jgi:hypothetical protein
MLLLAILSAVVGLSAAIYLGYTFGEEEREKAKEREVEKVRELERYEKWLSNEEREEREWRQKLKKLSLKESNIDFVFLLGVGAIMILAIVLSFFSH